jgi:hypothetical protein
MKRAAGQPVARSHLQPIQKVQQFPRFAHRLLSRICDFWPISAVSNGFPPLLPVKGHYFTSLKKRHLKAAAEAFRNSPPGREIAPGAREKWTR